MDGVKRWWNRIFEKRLASAFAWGDCVQVAGGEVLVIDNPARNRAAAAGWMLFGFLAGVLAARWLP